MEVEPVPYIFGSFNRRKSSHAHSHSEPNDNRKLAESIPVSNTPDARGRHAHSKSQPETGTVEKPPSSKQGESRALRTRSCNITLTHPTDQALLSASCPICKHVFLEPRVLECLHSFCTRCLLEIVEKNREKGEIWLPKDGPNNDSISQILDASTTNEIDVNYITCPVCNERTPLTRHGVMGLSPDYILQHRLVLATLNDENTKLLCDLCTGDVVAIERCSQCLVNVCAVCASMHRRHSRTAQHELLRIRDVRRRGLMRIQRHLMCHIHPEHELLAYCSTCEQIACHMCISHYHNGHRCAPCPPVAAATGQRLRRLLGRVKGTAAKDQALRRRLTAARRVVQRRCYVVAQEVERYMEEYRKLIDQHRQKLLGEIESIRASLLNHISSFESSLSTRLQSSTTAINFSQALLEEGSDVELLTFVNKLLKKLEDFEQPIKFADELKEILKQTTRDRNSDYDGLVDFIPLNNTVKDLDLENSKRNFDSFQRPVRHVLVDFVPRDEPRKTNDFKVNGEFVNRKSLVSNESARNSKNLQPIIEDTNILNNRISIKNEDKNDVLTEKKNSIKRKSNILKDQDSSKSISGILNHLKNCLETDKHEDKKISKDENTKIEEPNITSSTETILISHQSSLDNLSTLEVHEEPIILEFLPQEPKICNEKMIPIVFGQIQRMTSMQTDANNCCSATRPHLGGNPNHKIKNCCGILIENKVVNQPVRKNENGKVYQITI